MFFQIARWTTVSILEGYSRREDAAGIQDGSHFLSCCALPARSRTHVQAVVNCSHLNVQSASIVNVVLPIVHTVKYLEAKAELPNLNKSTESSNK